MSGLGTIDFVIIAIGAVLLILWLIFFFIGSKYNKLFEMLDDKAFPLNSIYGMGYAILELVSYNYKKSKGDLALRKQLDVLYGAKYSDYYLRVIHSQQVTVSFTILVLAFALYGLSGEILATAVGIMFAFVAYYAFGTATQKKILERSEELIHDFSEVVSKLALLTNAGLILREAWQEVAYAGEGIIYTEMRRSCDEMNNGIAEIDAIYNFGTRCIIPEIKKFTSTIIQGMTKGNSELIMMLQEQSKEVWQLKKQLARREGEKAASKLLFPMVLMFLGILIMIVVPIFANIGGV